MRAISPRSKTNVTFERFCCSHQRIRLHRSLLLVFFSFFFFSCRGHKHTHRLTSIKEKKRLVKFFSSSSLSSSSQQATSKGWTRQASIRLWHFLLLYFLSVSSPLVQVSLSPLLSELCLMTILIILIELEVETSQTKATDEEEIAFSSVNCLKRKKSDQLIGSPPITFPFFNREK